MLEFLLLSVYKFLLDCMYGIPVSVLSPGQGMDFTFTTLSWLVFAGSFLFFKGIVLSGKGMGEVLEFCFLFLYMVSYLPFLSLICFCKIPIPLIICNSVYFLILATTCRLIVRFCNFEVPLVKINRCLLDGFCIVLVLYCSFISYRYAHFRMFVSWDNVYVFRRAFADADVNKWVRRFFYWAGALMPFLVPYYLARRRLVMAVLGVVGSLLVYGVAGSKVIPCFLAITCVVFVLKITVKNRAFFYCLGVVFLLLAFCEYKTIHSYSFFRYYFAYLWRILFALNEVIANYFDFFITTHHPAECYLQTLSHFIEVPVIHYSNANPVPMVIGKIYGDSKEWRCCGLLGFAVMRLGYLGIFLMPFLSAFPLVVFSKLVADLDRRLVVLFSSFFLFYIMNGADFGFIAIQLFLFWLMRASESSEKIAAVHHKRFT